MPLFEFPRLDEDEAWWVQKEDEKFKLYEQTIRKIDSKYEKYLSETYAEYRENILSRKRPLHPPPRIMSEKDYQDKKDSHFKRVEYDKERMKKRMNAQMKENIFI